MKYKKNHNKSKESTKKYEKKLKIDGTLDDVLKISVDKKKDE
ncbi:hypothetical protein [Flagellimonas aequoris]|nr:hypothetical protein [Allomuricauda aequoris]